jgi:hypothetical protein
MNMDDIYLVSHKRIHVSEDELQRLRSGPHVTFPEDFCDFLRAFGPGEFCGCFFVFKPEDLANGQETCRRLWSESFFFERDKSSLSQAEVLDSTWVGRTLDGDEIVYRDAGKSGYFMLPRHSDVIFPVGKTLVEVLDWFQSAGVLYRPQKFAWFCTFKDRCRLHLTSEEFFDHKESLSLVNDAFGVTHAGLDDDEEFSQHFCKTISGYVHVYGEDLDIHYDSDFDAEVTKTAHQKFIPRGFRLVEHHRP